MSIADVSGVAFPARRCLPISYRHIPPAVHLTDFVLIIASSIATGIGYHLWTASAFGDVDQFAATGALVAILVVGSNLVLGLSQPEELLKLVKQLKCTVLAWSFALFLVLNVAFAWKVTSDLSRGAMLTFFPIGLLLMAGGRVSLYLVLSRAIAGGRLRMRNAAVVCEADADEASLAAHLRELRNHGFLPDWQFRLPATGSGRGGSFVRDLSGMIRGTRIDEVVIIADWARAPEIIEMIEGLHLLPIPVRYLPIGAAKILTGRPREMLGDAVLVDLQRGPMSGAERMTKVAFDKLFAGLGLFALGPLLLLCAVLIKLDSPGPVFFRQVRRGFNGRPFRIWKFRTMRVAEDGADVRQATVGDTRVTKTGRWLRRSSLDEIPQLLNVLMGEMSVVGPRPHAISHDDHYDDLIADYTRRHHVRPGLTGWAQVNGSRGETPTVEAMARRVELDLWYVQNWTFWRDLVIILRTTVHVVATPNAY